MNSCLQIFKLDFYGKKILGLVIQYVLFNWKHTNIWKHTNNTKKCVTQKMTLKSKGDIKIFKWIPPFVQKTQARSVLKTSECYLQEYVTKYGGVYLKILMSPLQDFSRLSQG